MTYTIPKNIQFVYEYYRMEKQKRFRMISMQKTQEQRSNKTRKKKQIFVRIKTVRLICISKVKMSQQMFKVTAISFHTAMQTFSRLINSGVNNGLLHTGPLSNQTHVHYMNNFLLRIVIPTK